MSNRIITTVRGDTLSIQLSITDLCNDQYTLEAGDILYFGLMDPHQLFENALVKKRYTIDDLTEDGNIIITLESKDTVDLYPGVYYYSIKLRKAAIDSNYDDEVITVINKTKFILND